MPDATDPAATLRQLAGSASDAPWNVEVDRGDASVWAEPEWVNGEPDDRPIGEVWDEGNAQFVAWCRNNAEAVATALERGAAAEAALTRCRDFLIDIRCGRDSHLVQLAEAALTDPALTAYDALSA